MKRFLDQAISGESLEEFKSEVQFSFIPNFMILLFNFIFKILV